MKLTKLTKTILVLLLVSSPLQAIEQWGFKIGYSSATQIWEHELIEEEDLSRRSGVCVGFYAQFFDHKGISLVTGIDYIQKGTGFEMYGAWGETPHEKTTHYSLYHYLSIPVIGKYTIKGEHVSTYFLLGPKISYFLAYADDEDHMHWGFEDDWNDFVLELSFGIGIEKDIFTDRTLLLEFIYNYEPFWQYDEFSTFLNNDIKVKNSCFVVSAGVGI